MYVPPAIAGIPWKRMDNGLLVPNHNALGAAAISWPTKDVWGGVVNSAIQGVSSGTRDYLMQREWGVPLVQTFDVATAVYDQITKYDSAGKTPLQQVEDYATILIKVITGAMKIVTAVAKALEAGIAVAKAISSITASVPLVGAVLDAVFAVFTMIIDVLAAYSENAAEAEHMVREACWQQCRANPAHIPITAAATGPNGALTPADMFRDNFIAGPGGGMPVSLGSMYILMCTPETQGYGPTRSQIAAGPPVGAPPWGADLWWPEIDTQTKREMMGLIRGIMASVREPGFHDPKDPPGDDGKSLWPTLNELISRKVMDIWLPKTQLEVDPSLVAIRVQEKFQARADAMFAYLAGVEYASWCAGGAAKACATFYCSCAPIVSGAPGDPGFNLAGTFVESIRSWQNQIETDVLSRLSQLITDNETALTNAPPFELNADISKALIAKSASYKGKVIATRSQTIVGAGRGLMQAKSIGPSTATKAITASQKAILMAGGLGGSYLAYRGIKTLAQHLRSR